MMNMVDPGLWCDLALAFSAFSLRGLHAGQPAAHSFLTAAALRAQGRRDWALKLLSKTWKTARTTRPFLSSCFHPSPCTGWKEHISDARRELEAASSGCVYVYHWNTLGCLTPCVIRSCQLHLPLQLPPASCTVYVHCVNQKVLHWSLGNNGRSSQTSGLTSSADLVSLHPELQCFVTMFPLSSIS